jgi:ABC-type amino acid transport substrate-binding protein
MHRRRFIGAAVGAAGIALSSRAVAEPFDIVYPRIRNGGDVHAAFALATLDVAMKAANATYTARQADVVMERGRALAELATGSTIDLHWTSMDAQAERHLNAVHIPIHRGLIGYRIFLIRRERQAEFAKVQTLDDLRGLTAGQGLSWVDTGILRNVGLKVQTATYENLFGMLEAGRIDYYPRGVIEAFAEADAHRDDAPHLTVEQHLLLTYRSDFLFYVTPSRPRLAETIARGFAAAYRDGSYMRLFNTHPYIQNGLRQARIAERRVIQLDNPYLSDADRAIPDMYWMGG